VTASWVAETADGQAAHLVMIVEDITERKAMESQLVHRSLHDPLTGLPNRLLFQDRLWHALERGRRENTTTCVLITDLDGFKAINDQHGHAAGDVLLKAVAAELAAHVRASDVVARLGGDEFGVLMWNAGKPQAMMRARDLEMRIDELPVTHGAAQLSVGASVGVTLLGGDIDVAALIDAADKAMYARKKERRG
jgi:diguanylate cyclase (GGDEF)-like protein